MIIISNCKLQVVDDLPKFEYYLSSGQRQCSGQIVMVSGHQNITKQGNKSESTVVAVLIITTVTTRDTAHRRKPSRELRAESRPAAKLGSRP